MEKRYLFIDVTSNNIHLAIFSKNGIIDTFVRGTNKDMIEHIIDDIKNIINKNNLNKQDIKRIYWLSNPGLYTGIRVGSLILKAWSTFSNIKVYELNKLIFQASSNCNSYLDAKGNKYYYAQIKNYKIIDEIKIVQQDAIDTNQNNIIDISFDFNEILKKFKYFKKVNIKKYELKYFKDAC